MRRMAHSMHWAVVGALLLAALGFAALGRWQLERAEENRAIAALFEDAAALPPLEQPVSAAEPFRYRAMRLRDCLSGKGSGERSRARTRRSDAAV